jgi:hypothetical protein
LVVTSAPSAGRLLVDRYSLVEVIGHGPASVVWKAWDEHAQREVAIKEIQLPRGLDDLESAVVLKKVLRDGRLAAGFTHPGAVPVHDIFEESGGVYVVMELFGGPTLAQVVADTGPLPPERAAAIGLDLLDTLEAAHAAGVLHRAVAPGNVVVRQSGVAQLSDFAVSASLIPGRDPGLSSFFAPEQTPTTGGTPAADLWALGATLRFAVVGDSHGAETRETDGDSPDPGPERPDQSGRSGPERPDQSGRSGLLQPALSALLADDPAARSEAAAVRPLLEQVAGDHPTAGNGVGGDQVGADAAPPQDVEPVAGVAVPTATQEGEPKTTREPWFFPVEVEVVPGSELDMLEVEPDRPPPPPPRRVSRWRTLGIAVMTVGLSFFMLALLSTRSGGRVRLGDDSTTVTVPADWFDYTDPQTGFSLSRPPDWAVTDRGTVTDFTEPQSDAFFRVDTNAALDESPQETWQRVEKGFSDHTEGYERVRLVATSFQGRPASIWEYRYLDDGVETQVVQLGFFAGDRPMVLRFQARADDWDRHQTDVAAFENSFRTPN